MTLIQAFTVPDDQPLAGDRNGSLRLSHEGILFQEPPCAVIRNSIIDPITGSIGVRFLSQWDELRSEGLHPKCVDVTLHKPSPANVSPITSRWHAVLASENGLPLHRDLNVQFHFFDALGDGHARGLFTDHCYYAADPDTDANHNNQSAVVRFMIDATQECCVATLGPFFPLPVEWKHFNSMGVFECDTIQSDCIRGRLFYVRFEKKRKRRFLVVIDVE